MLPLSPIPAGKQVWRRWSGPLTCHNVVSTLSSSSKARQPPPSKARLLHCAVLAAPVGRLYEGVFHKLPIKQTQHCHQVLLFSLFIVSSPVVEFGGLQTKDRTPVTFVLPFLPGKVKSNANRGGFQCKTKLLSPVLPFYKEIRNCEAKMLWKKNSKNFTL